MGYLCWDDWIIEATEAAAKQMAPLLQVRYDRDWAMRIPCDDEQEWLREVAEAAVIGLLGIGVFDLDAEDTVGIAATLAQYQGRPPQSQGPFVSVMPSASHFGKALASKP